MKLLFTSILFPVSYFAIAQQGNMENDTVNKLREVVISASRIKENILKSPVAIQVLTANDIKLTPSLSFFDALENIQGLQVTTPSLGFKVFNARGFSNTTNVRFAQLVDGMDISSPHIGAAIGNSLGPNGLDIEKVEILPGIASALYGMNTVNGLVNMITKNPFASQGISLQQNTALAHFSDSESDVKLYTETNFRYAKVLSSKFAFKINVAFTHGYDWIASDYADLNPKANSSNGLYGTENPAYDGINSYGNESSNRKTIALGGKNYVIARTGYNEKDLADNTLKNRKADAKLYYKFNEKSMLSYSYRFATLDNIYQRANRFKLEDYFMQQHGLQFENKSITTKIYINNESTGKSYNLRSMGENIDRDFKKDADWYNDFKTGFNTATVNGSAIPEALNEARQFADNGRYQPGTAAFNSVLGKLQDINNWDIGAALRVKQSFVQSEAQVDLTEEYFASLRKSGIRILTGIDNRTYVIMPDGNYFINPKDADQYSNFTYGKTGGFVSVTKKLLEEKLSLNAVVRLDKSDYFDTKLNPRASIVFSPSNRQNFRASIQSGYRFPSIFEAFSNVNSGGVKRVGGLPIMSSGIFENAYLQTSIANFQSAVLNDINNNNLTQSQAIEKNKALLKKNNYSYLTPEKVKSIEIGYKGLFLKNKLFIDTDFYFSQYKGFIAQTNMNLADTQNEAEIPTYLYDNSKQSKYRMYTNSQSAIKTYGFSLGVTYNFLDGFIAKANATYSKLENIENKDGLEDGFNTPNWMVNASLSKENIFKNIDAAIGYKWQNSYYWQSFLANGNVDSFTNINAQIAYKITTMDTKIKLGATNLLNNYYTSFTGGPSIGGMYYLTVIYGLK